MTDELTELRARRRLPARPLIDAVGIEIAESGRSVEQLTGSPTVRRAYYRAVQNGWVSVDAADVLATRLLGQHPSSIWGDAFHAAADMPDDYHDLEQQPMAAEPLPPKPTSAAPPPADVDSPGIVWEDPPEVRRPRQSQWAQLLAPLTAHPGRWARIRTYEGKTSGTGVAHQLKKSKDAVPPGRWEFTSRVIDGGSALYARYLGPEDGA